MKAFGFREALFLVHLKARDPVAMIIETFEIQFLLDGMLEDGYDVFFDSFFDSAASILKVEFGRLKPVDSVLPHAVIETIGPKISTWM